VRVCVSICVCVDVCGCVCVYVRSCRVYMCASPLFVCVFPLFVRVFAAGGITRTTVMQNPRVHRGGELKVFKCLIIMSYEKADPLIKNWSVAFFVFLMMLLSGKHDRQQGSQQVDKRVTTFRNPSELPDHLVIVSVCMHERMHECIHEQIHSHLGCRKACTNKCTFECVD
jgi:hypothetical protein